MCTVGHTKVRCQQPPAEEEGGVSYDGGAESGDYFGNAVADNVDATPAAGADSWASGPSAPAPATGNW